MRHATWSTALLLVLSACGGDADGSPRPSDAAVEESALPDLEARRVWSGSQFNFYVEAPSPDGRYLTDVDWTTGDLAVRDLTTGDLRRVTDKGPWRESSDYAEYGVFSPEGDRIAYSWFKGERGRPVGTQAGYELRSVDLDGSDMKVHIPAREDVRYVVTEDWSPDSSTILVTVARQDRTSQIGLLTLADDRYQILKSTDWRTPLTASFSRDGRWIAYDFPPDPESRNRDVFALAADGSREVPLVQGPAHERFMGWLPDGSGILFHRETDASKALYVQRVRDGRPVGDPELVKEDVWSIDPFGFSRDAFFYGVHVSRPQVHVATVDLEGARALSAPEPVVGLANPTTRFPAWSPDGQSLAYIAPLHGIAGAEVRVRSLTGEIVKRLMLPLEPIQGLSWTTAGLILSGTDQEGRVALWRLSLETGELEPIMDPPGSPAGDVGGLLFTVPSPDGRTIYVKRSTASAQREGDVSTLENSRSEVVAFDPASGEERVLAVLGPARRISVSPDGELLAVHGLGPGDGPRGIWVVPTDGGTPRLIHEPGPDRRSFAGHGTMPFTPDGRHVLWAEWDLEQGSSAPRSTIYKVAVDGSGATPLMETELAGRNLAVSPDGRRIAFEGGEQRGEIWRLSGFPASGDDSSGGPPRER